MSAYIEKLHGWLYSLIKWQKHDRIISKTTAVLNLPPKGGDLHVEAFNISLFVQQVGLMTPCFILMLKNEEDQQFVTELYFEYRELMYLVARRYFGNNEMDIEDSISIE